MTLKTVLNKVIVEPVEAETVTKGGIIIPDTAQEKPQSYFYCICQLIYPFFHQVTSFDIEFYFFCHNKLVLDFNFWDYLQFTIKELQGYHFGS